MQYVINKYTNADTEVNNNNNNNNKKKKHSKIESVVVTNDASHQLVEFFHLHAGIADECKSKNPRGLNEVSLPLARMKLSL